jgi:CDP-diglyceride synthetase
MAVQGGGSQLGQRVVTGVVLVAVAVAVLWLGGPAFAVLAAAAVLVMFTEWTAMHRLPLLQPALGPASAPDALPLGTLLRLDGLPPTIPFATLVAACSAPARSLRWLGLGQRRHTA